MAQFANKSTQRRPERECPECGEGDLWKLEYPEEGRDYYLRCDSCSYNTNGALHRE